MQCLIERLKLDKLFKKLC
uniref:Uncharacterized protein n=1 Tax=Anguilla anguilla TaxID=7936 RepID=A0A0E9QIE9_ANGAN